jgi:hypothetical protein
MRREADRKKFKIIVRSEPGMEMVLLKRHHGGLEASQR